MGDEKDDNAARKLAGYVTRIEALIVEAAELKDAIKAEYDQASSVGYDKKAIRQLIKERAADGEKTVEFRAIVETYRRSLGGLAGTPLGDWARGWMADDARLKQRGKEASSEFDAWMARRRERSAREDGDDDREQPGA